MKKITFLLSILVAAATTVSAQLQLPAPSPKASVMQTVGLTEITIDYSSPGVKGRVIWGELVPYNEVWRAGANAATKVTFSRDVTISGVSVPKGSYSLFVKPMKDAEWHVMLNKDASASESDYDAAKDVVSIKIKPMNVPLMERLTYFITDFTDTEGTVNIAWEKIRLPFKVMVDTEKQSMESIKSTLNGTWRNYANAARYMLDNKKDYDTGLDYIKKSLSLSPEQWYAHWIHAQLLKAKNMNTEAYAAAQKAKEYGEKAGDGFFFRDQVDKALVDWKSAAGGKKK